MEQKNISVGIVGTGFAGAFHYDALKRVYGIDIEIKGVHSRTKEKREAFANERGIIPYDSLEKLIEESDVIHICTPPKTHEEMAIMVLENDKFAVVEKPLTGYFGDSADFTGTNFPKDAALKGALKSLKNIFNAEKKSKGMLLYAENWVFAPAIRKESEIIKKTDAQILWMHGEESHSGSHSDAYGYWRLGGGGSMMQKGCHPLTAALYLKRVEGMNRNKKPIRPESVTARIHYITKSKNFIDKGHIRTGYFDIEDYSFIHVEFDDDTIADIFASELVMGGVHNWLEITGNNHRTICNINPNSSMSTYNPREEYFKDIYLVEKISSKQGWSNPSPDEDWFTGYQHEMQSFYESIANDSPIESGMELASDTIRTIYSAYLSAEKGGTLVEVPEIAY